MLVGELSKFLQEPIVIEERNTYYFTVKSKETSFREASCIQDKHTPKAAFLNEEEHI